MPQDNQITNSQESNIATNQQNKQGNPGARGSNAVKEQDERTTGDEPMTGAQYSYLKTLSAEAGEVFDGNLTKAEASKRIEILQQIKGRGVK